MKDKLMQIINHYGVSNQLRKFTEEYFELVEAIIKAEESNLEDYISIIDHITEEIADCYVLIEQFRLKYSIPIEEIQNVMRYKISRQLERIKNEQ
jgi:NTP pyrophosphatase (non-canonical NTP hydrolase)